MSVLPKECLASLGVDLEFRNGVLAREQSTGDGTMVPRVVVEAVMKVLPGLLTAEVQPGAAGVSAH
jgi:hypothetical protein